MVFRIGCNTEERLCYDVFSYVNIKDKIINEIKLCKYKGNYNTIKNIDNIYEFEVALNAKAEEGIKIVHYDNELFYIVPTVINKLSSDPASHLMIYEMQKNHPSWNRTTNDYKEQIELQIKAIKNQ